jgi:hypothetical protein
VCNIILEVMVLIILTCLQYMYCMGVHIFISTIVSSVTVETQLEECWEVILNSQN